jgi:hypothetical protein
MGSVIAAEPREHLPYGYWIVVSRASATGVMGLLENNFFTRGGRPLHRFAVPLPRCAGED